MFVETAGTATFEDAEIIRYISIDDESPWREKMEEWSQDFKGCECRTFHDVDKFVRSGIEVHLIFLDVYDAGLTTPWNDQCTNKVLEEKVKKIRSLYPDTPIVLLSHFPKKFDLDLLAVAAHISKYDVRTSPRILAATIKKYAQRTQLSQKQQSVLADLQVAPESIPISEIASSTFSYSFKRPVRLIHTGFDCELKADGLDLNFLPTGEGTVKADAKKTLFNRFHSFVQRSLNANPDMLTEEQRSQRAVLEHLIERINKSHFTQFNRCRLIQSDGAGVEVEWVGGIHDGIVTRVPYDSCPDSMPLVRVGSEMTCITRENPSQPLAIEILHYDLECARIASDEEIERIFKDLPHAPLADDVNQIWVEE